jgi:hypothetical protein
LEYARAGLAGVCYVRLVPIRKIDEFFATAGAARARIRAATKGEAGKAWVAGSSPAMTMRVGFRR